MTKKIIGIIQIAFSVTMICVIAPMACNMHKNNNKAEVFLDNQKRMTDSMRKYVSDYNKCMFWRDSHDYYFGKVFEYVGKTTK